MEIIITGRSIEMTPALRDYAQEKAAKLEEFFKNIQKVEVILEARHIENADRAQVAEIRAWMGGLKMIQAQEGGRDLYAAIDLVMAEAKRQIEKHKEKTKHETIRQAKKLKNQRHAI
jgi:putative sigma-54 modulation protein